MAGRRGPRRELNAEERAVLVELADGAWRTSAEFAPRPHIQALHNALSLLSDRGLVRRKMLPLTLSRGIPRRRYRITDAGRAKLPDPDRADG
jgi:Transcriptional regulator PadR-like family